MDDAPHGPTFEELLASPHLQFDLDNELLPHLIAFGPSDFTAVITPRVNGRRPWLFDADTSMTVVADSGTSATGGVIRGPGEADGDQISLLLSPGFILSARHMRQRECDEG